MRAIVLRTRPKVAAEGRRYPRRRDRLAANAETARDARRRETPNDANARRRECRTARMPNDANAEQRKCRTAQMPNSANAEQREMPNGAKRRIALDAKGRQTTVKVTETKPGQADLRLMPRSEAERRTEQRDGYAREATHR